MAQIGVRALALVFGASYTGAYLYNHADAARGMLKRILGEVENAKSANEGNMRNSTTTVDGLAAQLSSLRAELMRRDGTVVVMPGSTKEGWGLIGWGVVVIGVGAVGWGVVKGKLDVREFGWVSKRRFAETVSKMEEALGRVRGVVGGVRKELGERLGILDETVEGVRKVGERIGEEVQEVKVGVGELGGEVRWVRERVEGVGERVQRMEGKVDRTNEGIYALVKMVYGVLGGRAEGRGLGDLERFMLEMERQVGKKESAEGRGLLGCLGDAGNGQVSAVRRAKSWAMGGNKTK